MAELKSDCGDDNLSDGRSNYDLNDYTQGNYDGMIGSGENSPAKEKLRKAAKGGIVKKEEPKKKKKEVVDDEKDDPAECTDIASYVGNSDDDDDGAFVEEDGDFEVPIYSQGNDIREFMDG